MLIYYDIVANSWIKRDQLDVTCIIIPLFILFNYQDDARSNKHKIVTNIEMMIRSVVNAKDGKIFSLIVNLPVKKNDVFLEHTFQYFVRMTNLVIRKEK